MNENNLNQWIQSNLPDIPPDDIIKNVTPWKKFIYYIIGGLILNTVTFEYYNLHYILPLIGCVMLMTGFQALRLENRYFKIGWVFSTVNLITMLLMLILNSTLYQAYGILKTAMIVISIVRVFAFYSLYRCLVIGLKEMKEKCGMKLNHKIERSIMTWCSILILMCLIARDDALITILMVISYVALIWNLMKLINEIKEAGYGIHLAPIFLSTKMIVPFIVIILAVGCMVGYSFYDSYPMEWTKRNIAQNEEIQSIKNHLLELGFPEDVLDDISEEDIFACKNAKSVVVNENTLENDQLKKDIPEDFLPINIAVELGNLKHHYKIFHYFRWKEDEEFHGTECIVVWPVTKGHQEDWTMTSDYTGNILCEKAGDILVSPYASKKEVNVDYPSQQYITSDMECIAEFSYPNDVNNCRGYISYSAVAKEQWNMVLNSWISYVHQERSVIYPVKTAADYWLYRTESTKEFDIIQTAIHFSLK